MRYFDASALAKRYLHENDSDWVVQKLDHPPATSRLTAVEVASAFARRCREKQVSEVERDRGLATLMRDLDELLIVELSPGVVAGSLGILRRNALRASDAIQIASCVSLAYDLGTDIPFVAFDERLRAAATAEGLTVEP